MLCRSLDYSRPPNQVWGERKTLSLAFDLYLLSLPDDLAWLRDWEQQAYSSSEHALDLTADDLGEIYTTYGLSKSVQVLVVRVDFQPVLLLEIHDAMAHDAPVKLDAVAGDYWVRILFAPNLVSAILVEALRTGLEFCFQSAEVQNIIMTEQPDLLVRLGFVKEGNHWVLSKDRGLH